MLRSLERENAQQPPINCAAELRRHAARLREQLPACSDGELGDCAYALNVLYKLGRLQPDEELARRFAQELHARLHKTDQDSSAVR